jgi:hypothetical protein
METKGSHARMDVGVEAGRLVWSGGAGGGWGFHHIFGSPGFPIALPYIYCILWVMCPVVGEALAKCCHSVKPNQVSVSIKRVPGRQSSVFDAPPRCTSVGRPPRRAQRRRFRESVRRRRPLVARQTVDSESEGAAAATSWSDGVMVAALIWSCSDSGSLIRRHGSGSSQAARRRWFLDPKA